jgi:hypothetical protein
VNRSTNSSKSFRTQHATAAADGDFAAFHNAAFAPVTGPNVGPVGLNGGMQGPLPRPSSDLSTLNQMHGYAAPGTAAPSRSFASTPAHSDLRTGFVGPSIAQNNSWVTEFAQMNLNQVPSITNTMMPAAPSSFQSPYHAPRMPGTYMQYQFSTQAVAHTSAATTQVAPVNAAEDAAFSQAFEAYDDGFQSSLDEWMAQNGPHADSLVDQQMERIASDQELQERIADPSLLSNDQDAESQAAHLEEETAAKQKRAEQEELADAAGSILSAVAGNTSERFQNSRFLQTMRRIANYEVVAENNDLVDAETGQSVVTGRPEDEGEGKGKENDINEVLESTQ